MMQNRVFRLTGAALIAIACLGAYTEDVSRGDLAWQRRAEGASDGIPQREPIRAAVSAYESALRARPDSLEAHWKLLRALYFAGFFAERGDADQRRETFERGLEVSERGIELLAARTQRGQRFDELDVTTLRSRLAESGASQTDVARLYFWSAISWGVWARDVGLLRAVYEGAANRLHRYTLITIELEPALDVDDQRESCRPIPAERGEAEAYMAAWRALFPSELKPAELEAERQLSRVLEARSVFGFGENCVGPAIDLALSANGSLAGVSVASVPTEVRMIDLGRGGLVLQLRSGKRNELAQIL